MRHLVRSFQSHIGTRGCHFYDENRCNFLTWKEVFHFIDSLPPASRKDTFAEKLADTLANYDPDQEFLAVQQSGDSVSVELYSHPKPYEEGRSIR